MKSFCVLIAVGVFAAILNNPCLAEDVTGDISNTTQISVKNDTTSDELLLKEGGNEENLTQAEWEARERDIADKALFEKKCSKCHTKERPLSKKKTLKEWRETVERMHKKDLTWILPAEAVTIADYLYKINGLKEDGAEQNIDFQLKKAK